MAHKVYTWDEIKKHNSLDSLWITIDKKVYDVTKWIKYHPGGMSVILHYAGQDATEAFKALHAESGLAYKRLSHLYLGEVSQAKEDTKELNKDTLDKEVMKDFDELRVYLKGLGLFDSNLLFFFAMLLQILFLDALSFINLFYYGISPLRILISIALHSTAQAQASWLQHDFGHISVFKSLRLNHIFHQITMGFIKGASCHWWKHMHNQHHVKPNVIGKDPDVRLQPVFVVGDTIPKEVAESDQPSILPYNHQHKYFFAIGPPLLFPIYFQIMTFRHMIVRKRYEDLLFVTCHWIKFLYLYYPLLGLMGCLSFYFISRMVESHWFTWVSQSNHIPMAIEHDTEESWLPLQLHATCDIQQSLFNDWFTGHLNFQIEHHLFPTMPRHNYSKAQPYVRKLCDKHNIPYYIKPLGSAFADIIRSLRKSGKLWEAVYHAHHM